MASSALHSLGRGIYLKAHVGLEGISGSEKASSEKISTFSLRGRIWDTSEHFCFVLRFWGCSWGHNNCNDHYQMWISPLPSLMEDKQWKSGNCSFSAFSSNICSYYNFYLLFTSPSVWGDVWKWIIIFLPCITTASSALRGFSPFHV